ncbi:MAG: C4-dicarboxylate transporter DctA, partial [Burkholderiaceae bacterium]
FVSLIRMMIAPVIFCVIVQGIASMSDLKKVGTVGIKTLVYFELVSTLALIIGIAVAVIARPGVGLNIDASMLDPKAAAVFVGRAKEGGLIPFLLGFIPQTYVGALAGGEVPQVLLISILTGFAIARMGELGRRTLEIIEMINKVVFGMVRIIVKAAPLGALGGMAFTVGSYGMASLSNLVKLMGTFYLTCLVFVFVVLGLIARFNGFSIWKFVKYIKEELFIVLGTSSSESVLPRMILKMENLGVEKSVVGLVIPTGYSFNLDGTSIYLTMAAVFIAQATNTPMTIMQQVTLLMILLLTSKGAAGVTGSGFIVLAATLSAVGGVPVAGLALILGIDRFMSEARALTNLVGNGVATIVVAKWTKELDTEKMHKELEELDHSNAEVSNSQ